MLTRKQLEDAAKCCSLKCKDCSMGKDIEICVERTAETAIALADMLKRLEWCNDGAEFGKRHICGAFDVEGHKPDCELAALLKKVRGEG